MTIFWFVLTILLSAIEFLTTSLIAIWFAIGALSATIISFFNTNFLTQIIVFIAASLITLFFTRKFVKNKLLIKHEATNFDALVGKRAKVISEITDSSGRVHISGLDWSAKTDNDVIIPNDSIVIVKSIQGVTLIVENI